jgi:hypothetical protein
MHWDAMINCDFEENLEVGNLEVVVREEGETVAKTAFIV